MEPDSPSILVPADEAARQAIAPWAGYIYQLYQTVRAWQALGENERLYVELAEDFAVSSGGESLDMFQVKRAKSALTLRSKAVAALIGSVWKFQKANPDRVITAALITTGRIGRERGGHSFPDKMPGLEYWRVAAREEADLTPLLGVLLDLKKLPADLIDFLRTSSPQEVRDHLLRRIRWMGAGDSQNEVQRDIEDRLVHFGHRVQVGAQDAKNALSALVVAVLECVRRPPADRYLTAADLRSRFEKHTYRLVPPSILAAELAEPALAAQPLRARLPAPRAASIPLPPRASPRTSVVGSLHAEVVRRGRLWLHGSGGLGKTTLALLLARRQSVPWAFSALRNLEGSELRAALAQLNEDLSTERGLILDDLPSDADNDVILRLRQLARTVVAQDGVLVITSDRPPSPTLQEGLGLTDDAIRAVPYLTEEDVAAMVVDAGGDPRTWTRAVYLFAGGGHPQLVGARIAGLRRRGWSSEERFAELDPKPDQPSDIARERQAVRRRLLRELEGESMELLLRLSLFTNAFDKLIMQEVASIEPAVPHAGLVFEAILGPWIEQLGADLFRLSPLLSDSGREGLTQELQRRIRSQVLEHLILRRPFPGEQFLQVLLLAYPLGHRMGLTWFAGALLSTTHRDKETFRRLAQEVSSFTAFDRGEKRLLFAADAHLSCFLRLAQLHVAVATDRPGRAANILDRLLWEIEALPPRVKARVKTMALGTAIMERTIPLPPARWIGMLHEMAATPDMGKQLKRRPKFPGPIADLIGPTYEEMLFLWRASALDGIDELASLIETLDQGTPANRDRYLAAARNSRHGRELIVSSAWLAEVRKSGFDSRASAARLADLYRIASGWSNHDVAVEIGCAQAILLDEYAHDREAALAVLAAVQADFPTDYRINRQRQRIYYRAGDHAQALLEFETFGSALERVAPIERTWTLREAGRSAALTGDRIRALSFFQSAWEASRSGTGQMAVMRAGLSADCAVLEFEEGHIEVALELMLRALTEADAVDFNTGLREHYCALILLAAILWMRGAAEDWPADRQAMVIGMCSEPNPRPELKERRLPQRLMLWYQLAELEADRTESEAVLTALRERTGASGLLPMEATLSVSLTRRAVRTSNVDLFIKILPLEPRAAQVGVEVMAKSNPDNVYEMPAGKLIPLSPAEWSDPSFARFAMTTVLVFAIVAVCSGRPEVLAQLRTRLLEIDGLLAQLTTLFAVIDEPAIGAGTLLVQVASTVGRMLEPDHGFDAAGAFAATVYFFQFLRGHELGEVAAAPVFTHFSHVWRDILANRRFSVRAPAVSEPAILESLARGGAYRTRLAHLILASEAAVTTRLSDDLRAAIQGAAKQTS